MGFPGKLKFPIISNDFANCGHKGELSAVFSAIYYLKVMGSFEIDQIQASTSRNGPNPDPNLQK